MSSLDASLFVSDTLHARTVTLPDGSEHTFHFKELPAVEFRRFHIAEQSGDEERQAASMARLLSVGLCEPDGKPALTFKQALRLKAGPMNALFVELVAVNGMGEKKAESEKNG